MGPRRYEQLRLGLRLIVLTPAAAMYAGGCGAAQNPQGDPSTAVRAFRAAVEWGEADAVRASLAAGVQNQYDTAAIQRLLTENQREIADEAGQVDQAARSRVVQTARVRLASGEVVALVREQDGWHISAGIADLPALAEPLDAVAALRRALQRGTQQALLGVLALESRAAYADKIARVLEETADPARLQITLSGEQASVRTPSGHRIHLRRENGEWRVVDFE